MSRPLSEQSTEKEVGRLDWRTAALERRVIETAEGEGTVVMHLFSWNYDTANTIPTETWRAVANPTNESYYEEVKYTTGTTMTFDFDTGAIGLNDDAVYQLQGWVQFWTDAVDGEKRIVAINFGSSERHIAVFPFEASMGSIAAHMLPVSTPRLIIGSGSATLEVWHNHGSDIAIRDAEFVARRFELVSTLTDELRP